MHRPRLRYQLDQLELLVWICRRRDLHPMLGDGIDAMYLRRRWRWHVTLILFRGSRWSVGRWSRVIVASLACVSLMENCGIMASRIMSHIGALMDLRADCRQVPQTTPVFLIASAFISTTLNSLISLSHHLFALVVSPHLHYYLINTTAKEYLRPQQHTEGSRQRYQEEEAYQICVHTRHGP